MMSYFLLSLLKYLGILRVINTMKLSLKMEPANTVEMMLST